MSVLLLLALPATLAAPGVKINEVLYNPAGEDAGNEWIELCNSGSTTVDLTGWTVQGAGTTWSTLFTFPSLSIAPGEHLLIGAGSAYTLSGTVQNGGGTTDGLRIVNGSTTVDTVLYDEPNENLLVDDSGGAGTEFAPTVGEGSSLGRSPDCSDSEDSSIDFVGFETPSPGEENSSGGGGECADPEVRLNEVMMDPVDTDTDAEWVELYNPTSRAIDLSGWAITMRKSESGSATATLPEGTWIEAGDWLVVGETLVSSADVVLGLDLGNDTSSVDSVELYCEGTLLDVVVYGGENDLGWAHEDGVLATVVDKPGEGVSIGRFPDGQDSNDCATDWIALPVASPGASNAAEVDCGCAGSGEVVINEFLPNPSVPKGGEDEDPEWVELHNIGAYPVTLSGWSLRYGTSPSSLKTVDISGLGSIEPGGFLVVGEEGAPNVDLVITLDMGAASSNSDRVELLDCSPCASDTVVYGDDNEDGWTDDSGEIATSLAPGPSDGETLQRCRDGSDTDQSATDWVIATSATPGEPNEDEPCPICVPGSTTIKINELYPDPEGADGDQEWVELYNAGSESQRLDGWVIEAGTSSWGVDFTFPGEVELAPGEFLLIGDVDVPTADLIASSLSLGNSSANPDGVRLIDCVAAVQDTVLYGDGEGEAEDLELLDDQGGATMATMGESGLSIGRRVDGQDSDDNSADFSGTMPPTPGGANEGGSGDGGSSDGGDDDDEGGGCNKKGSSGGGKKCGIFGVAGGLEWVVLALVAIRRRRT